MIVLGGGAIGTELAQVFSRFGTEVTVVEQQPRLVSFEEPEASDLIERIFTPRGHQGVHRRPGRADRPQ